MTIKELITMLEYFPKDARVVMGRDEELNSIWDIYAIENIGDLAGKKTICITPDERHDYQDDISAEIDKEMEGMTDEEKKAYLEKMLKGGNNG